MSTDGPAVDPLDSLRTDPLYTGEFDTGILVRAIDGITGRWIIADIAALNRQSLDAWLRSRDIDWPIGVVMHLLGHTTTGEEDE